MSELRSTKPYDGPPVTVKLLQLQTYPPQNVVSIELTAPTGGWKLTLDKGEVVDNTAKVYFTLERPGKGEMVTQSLVVLNGSYKTTSEFAKTEVYINQTQRGVQKSSKEYQLASTLMVNGQRPIDITNGAVSKPQTSAPAQDKYSGPPATVEVVQYKRLPPISEAMVQVTVPTGGWTLKLDRGEVAGDTAKIYLTLERPAEGEVATQALATLELRFKSEKPPFFHAEVYIHEAQRGVQTLTTDYRLAASK